MNPLIATLLNCPNLSLRVLDPDGRAIKTLNQEQLRQYFNEPAPSCTQDCGDTVCEKHVSHLN